MTSGPLFLPEVVVGVGETLVGLAASPPPPKTPAKAIAITTASATRTAGTNAAGRRPAVLGVDACAVGAAARCARGIVLTRSRPRAGRGRRDGSLGSDIDGSDTDGSDTDGSETDGSDMRRRRPGLRADSTGA
jgi:hypothetical protein